MQFFDRRQFPPPKAFQTPDFDAERQRLAQFWERGFDRMAQSDFDEYLLPLNDASILDGLRAVFREKCAFCESRETVHPHRFRPSRGAYPAATNGFPHLYYVWLAHAWENVHAICADCAPADEGYFPVKTNRAPLPSFEEIERFADSGQGAWGLYPPRETPLLLDPCVDLYFFQHLAVTLDGRIHPLSPTGEATIKHYSLDRPPLERRRAKAFARYWRDLLSAPLSQSLEENEVLDFINLEFGGAWYLHLRERMRELPARLTVSRGAIAKSILQALRTPGLRPFLERGFASRPPPRGPAPPTIASAPPPPPERRPAPRLQRIEIENFKSIANLSLSLGQPRHLEGKSDPRPPALLLLGENAVGKSSILEAITLACLSRDAVGDLGLTPGHLVLKPERLGGTARDTVSRARVELIFASGATRALELMSETVMGPTDEVPVFAYGAFRRYENEDDGSAFPNALHQASLFHSRYALPHPGAWLATLHDQQKSGRFLMVARALNKLFGVEDDTFRMIRVRDGACFIAAAEDANAAFSAETPLEEASSGFRSILSMVCDICAGLMNAELNPSFDQLDSAAAIVLIDEIEAHLHPRWKMRVMRGLRDALPQVTFIVSSHEPLCLRGMDSGEVRVLYREVSEAKGDLPVRVKVAEDLPDFQRMTIEQILTSDFFSLFTTDAIEAERDFARMADLMARRKSSERPLSEEERRALDNFEREIAIALPIGASHAQRLIQEAVAANLAARRAAGGQSRAVLDRDTVARIQDILGDI